MEIEVKIDAAFEQPKVVVYAARVDNEVSALLDRISPPASSTIVGFQGEVASLLEPAHIVRVYAEKQKVYADVGGASFTIRLRLYELEKLLAARDFVRISNSEIINLRQIDNLDFSITGTVCIRLQNGKTVYVSRRYVSKIKSKLGL